MHSTCTSIHLNVNNKPVTFWSGITEIDGEQTFKFDIPDYFNGKLRVMATSVTPERIGARQTTALIQDDFVLSPNAPYVVAPNDEFEVSLSVANNLIDQWHSHSYYHCRQWFKTYQYR